MSGGLVYCSKESSPIFFPLLSLPLKSYRSIQEAWQNLLLLSRREDFCLWKVTATAWSWNEENREGEVERKQGERKVEKRRDRTTKLAYCDTVSLALLRFFFFLLLSSLNVRTSSMPSLSFLFFVVVSEERMINFVPRALLLFFFV